MSVATWLNEKKNASLLCMCIFACVCGGLYYTVQYRRNPKPHYTKDVQYMPLDENDQNVIQRIVRYWASLARFSGLLPLSEKNTPASAPR